MKKQEISKEQRKWILQVAEAAAITIMVSIFLKETRKMREDLIEIIKDIENGSAR